jgi:hypothetical protein
VIVEMREDKHLWIKFDPSKGDFREVIIDEEHRDIRVCDGKNAVVKIRFDPTKQAIQDVLVNDIFVYPAPGGRKNVSPK